MAKPILRISVLFVLSILLLIQGSTSFEQENRIQSIQTQFSNQEAYQNLDLSPDFGKIPLYFVPNRGQVDETALFYTRTSRYTLWLTEKGLVFDSTRRIKKESTESIRQNPRDINNPEDVKYDRDISRLVFVKANRSPEVIPVEATEHKVNYFIGNDKSEWRTNIQTSRAVLYKELYPNIDLKVYGIEKQIEYDFVVKLGGEVSDIGFEYKGAEERRIDEDGNLVIKTKFGELKHAKPVCYQVIGGERVEIKAEFKSKEDNTYGFQVKEYNKNYELIIDPLVLVYSTFLGGSGADSGRSIAVDSTGSIYVAGFTSSMDFPTKNSIQGSYAGGGDDAFITKINASGTDLVYSTYLGGSGDEGRCETCIAVDSEGAAYVTGWTASIDFPTKNPIQGSNAGGYDVLITKINSAGNELIYSTYLGGSGVDGSLDMAVDSEGAVYLTGYTNSIDFPTQNPIQGTNAGDSDIFLAKVNSSGSDLIYSTYLGGRGEENSEGLAVDLEGAAYVTGFTRTDDFPALNPIQGSYGGGERDAIIAKLSFTSSTPTTYSLTITAGSGGTTDPLPGTYTHDEGTEITITATTNSGYIFVAWSGDVTSTANPITITMDSDKSIKANFTQESGGDGGDGGGICFIATTCYGTPMAEEVKILCAFRDQYLVTNPLGRALVNIYYIYSPKVADFIQDKEYLKTIVRECLKPIIRMISRVLE